jgi:hypothetical protein
MGIQCARFDSHQSAKMSTLDQYFNFENELISDSSLRYSNSLTPKWDIFKLIKGINFFVGYIFPKNILQKRVPLENEINTHQYKPIFIKSQTADYLDCYVASEDIFVHTVKHLCKVATFLKIQKNISIEIDRQGTSIGELISSWNICNSIIFCNLQSFTNFLTYKSLLSEKIITFEQFIEISTHIELSRIGIDTKCGDRLTKLFAQKNGELNLRELITTSVVIKGIEAEIDQKPVTLFQLPWGMSMASELSKAIVSLNKNINFVGIIGGIGFDGPENIELDSCFFPSEIINPYLKNRIQVELNMGFQKSPFLKSSIQGSLTSLMPISGVNHMVKDATQKLGAPISAVDMEAAAIVSNFHNVAKKLCLGYYIMDLNQDGKRFGDTYYNPIFLETLFKDSKRGKYFIMDTILERLKIS